MPIVRRKLEQSIQIGRDIIVTITEIHRGHVAVHVDAPGGVEVRRVDGLRKSVEKLRTAVVVTELTKGA